MTKFSVESLANRGTLIVVFVVLVLSSSLVDLVALSFARKGYGVGIVDLSLESEPPKWRPA